MRDLTKDLTNVLILLQAEFGIESVHRFKGVKVKLSGAQGLVHGALSFFRDFYLQHVVASRISHDDRAFLFVSQPINNLFQFTDRETKFDQRIT